MTTWSGLPARRVRLYGRDADAAAIRELLATSPGRLVTVVGPGGCGKTSLALELAHQAVPAFAEEGLWVELETSQHGASVAAAVAAAAGASASEGGSPAAIIAAMRGRQALLVVDNCEHVLASIAPLIDALLAACPDLRVLTTSRAPLRVRGEHLYPLGPLAVPDADAVPEREGIERSPSVALFLERSRAAGGRPKRDPAEIAAIARICRRLDGLPLAIELAAAQALIFSPAQIAERLEARLALPVQAGRALPERQQTIDATLDWSYSLLPEADQRLFELASVFNGSWTMEALESVAGEEAPEVAAGLARLVESSLVATSGGTERRYRLLAPVREYAMQRAAARGMVAEARARHARYYMERARSLTGGQGQRPLHSEELAAIRADYENIVAAADWAVQAGQTVGALRLAQSLWIYWRVSGQAQQGLERTRALVRCSFERADDMGFCHEITANLLQLLGRHDEAMEHSERALELFRDSGNLVGLTLALGTRGELASEVGDPGRARHLLGEGLELHQHPRSWSRGIFLTGLGVAEYRAGEFERATSILREAEATFEHVSEMWYRGLVKVRLGCLARKRGDVVGALRLLREGVTVLDHRGHAGEVAHALEEMAGAECDRGEYARAATLLGAAGRLRETAATPVAPTDKPTVDRSLRRARRALNEATFASAWVRGRALSRGEAVAFAMDESGAGTEDVSPLAELTSREREVARLVAEGLTNSQIAARLVISEATARTHVERIRRKLGVHSRASIARALTVDGV